MPIKNLKASPNKATNGPTGLKIRTSFPDEKKTYGNFDEEDNNKWIFNENKPLIGFYGILSDTQKIDMLGFITLNVHCQEALETVIVKEPEEPETFPEKHIGANLPAPFIILFGTILYVALLIAAKVYEVRHQAA